MPWLTEKLVSKCKCIIFYLLDLYIFLVQIHFIFEKIHEENIGLWLILQSSKLRFWEQLDKVVFPAPKFA